MPHEGVSSTTQAHEQSGSARRIDIAPLAQVHPFETGPPSRWNNSMRQRARDRLLDGLKHSPWIAERALQRRPFKHLAQLKPLVRVLAPASEAQLALITTRAGRWAIIQQDAHRREHERARPRRRPTARPKIRAHPAAQRRLQRRSAGSVHPGGAGRADGQHRAGSSPPSRAGSEPPGLRARRGLATSTASPRCAGRQVPLKSR